ncbi:hypothetical protein GF386_01340 [Candidatus Pacearchaeota archaeon]|nr:hypothetical protein [Candidatus Pacearchaeota archaeon]
MATRIGQLPRYINTFGELAPYESGPAGRGVLTFPRGEGEVNISQLRNPGNGPAVPCNDSEMDALNRLEQGGHDAYCDPREDSGISAATNYIAGRVAAYLDGNYESIEDVQIDKAAIRVLLNGRRIRGGVKGLLERAFGNLDPSERRKLVIDSKVDRDILKEE